MKPKVSKVAIFTDIHSLLEPLEAVLEDIKKKNISEIYSLGDNIGNGPNPHEVLQLLKKYKVHCIAGNSEDYVLLGIEPFIYLNNQRIESHLWTLSKLTLEDKEFISSFSHSFELNIAGKKIALCHFANDVRMDYKNHSTYVYQDKLKRGEAAYKQFFYTNSKKQLQHIQSQIKKYGLNNPYMKGYINALEEPLFHGKLVSSFDVLIQGHTHFKIFDSSKTTKFYSIRALGMAYGTSKNNTASYIILSEENNNLVIEEVLVNFDREKMKNSLLCSKCPDNNIFKYLEFEKD